MVHIIPIIAAGLIGKKMAKHKKQRPHQRISKKGKRFDAGRGKELVFQTGNKACAFINGKKVCKPIDEYAWFIAGKNKWKKNFYEHTPIDVDKKTKMITIRDGMLPKAHTFKVPFDFFMKHTKHEHKWSTKDKPIKDFFEGK